MIDVSWLFEIGTNLGHVNPWHLLVEVICVLIIVYLLTSNTEKREPPLTEKEVSEMVKAWKPAPLVPDSPPAHTPLVIEGMVGPHVSIKGKDVINFASYDFLGLIGNKEITDKACDIVDQYGCGSCGPRGFYGSIDVHVQLEQEISKFLHTSSTILYSSEIATASSTLPAFAKAGDVVLCDSHVTFAVQEGARLSRAEVVVYAHNDMVDLENKMKEIVARDQGTGGKKKKLQRRFVAFEAISHFQGDIAPLQKLIELRNKYKFYLLMDESLSFGVLGKTGRGLTEHCGVQAKDVDIIVASLSNAICSIGGFCTSTSDVVDHQRLSGSGYVFSASSPPHLSVVAIAALHSLAPPSSSSSASSENKWIADLRAKAKALHKKLSTVCAKHKTISYRGHEESPVGVLCVGQSSPENDAIARKLHQQLLEKGVLGVELKCSIGKTKPLSGVQLNVSRGHTDSDISRVADVVAELLQTL